MDDKPTFNRELILPILLGVLSVVGIGLVFVFGHLSNERQVLPVPGTETPYRFVYLGTEPGLSTLTPEATDTPLPTATELSLEPVTFAPLTNTAVILSTNQTPLPSPTYTYTPSPTLASVLSKIDDTYFELLYSGDWDSQSNVSDTYQNTLHISFTVGDYVSFTFVGEQVIVSFQSGPSLGTIEINLDGLLFDVDQSSSNTELVNWTSSILIRGTHTLQITHLSGGSVNLDSITIPDISTPTPTATPTATSTP